MPTQFTLPPDTRSVGSGNPPADMNGVVDTLTAMGAGYNVLNAAFAGGADPGGTADSTAAIQAAINALPSTGGIIDLPAGRYKVSSTLTATALPVTIRGAGRWATQINFTGTGDCIRMYTTANLSTQQWGGGVRDLTIDGGGAGAGSAGLHIGDNAYYELNVHVQNFSGAGSIGVHLDNQYWWTEECRGTISARNNTQNIVFDVTSPATTVAAGSNGGTISGIASWSSPSAGVLAVASTALLPAAGTVNVAASGATTAVVTYTGISGNTLTGCAYVSGSPSGTVATGGTVTLVTSTNSFGYLDLACYVQALANQDGVAVQNGAYLYHGNLVIKGNISGSASAVSSAVLRLTGTVPAGHTGAGSGSAVIRSRLDIQVEAGTFANQPTTIIFNSASANTIQGCYGILDFTQGSGSFTGSNVVISTSAGTMTFEGLIAGDGNLNPAGNFPQPVTVGSKVYGKSFMSGVNGNTFAEWGDFFAATLSASITVNLAPSGQNTLAAPQRKTIALTQAAAGGPFTVTWPQPGSPSVSSPAIYWPGGTAPVMSAAAGAVDVYQLETLDGIRWYGTVIQAGTGPVTSVAAADTSIVVGGTAPAPAIRTGTLDVIAAQHPAAADWSNNSHKITSLANGSGAQDAAAFGQIPAVEGTAGNIKPTGPAAALGSSGKWPNSDHVHFSSGMYLCAPNSYAPGTRTAVTVNTTTMAAWSSANICTNTFTAPASGNVVVTADIAALSNSVSGNITGFGLAAHGTVSPLAANAVTVQAINTNFHKITLIFYVTGLTPGSSYQFDLLGCCTSATTSTIEAQGQTGTALGLSGGPVTMTVQAA